MAPIRPEFFYHPAVGVVSPTSLGLFAFKSGPLVVTSPPPVISKTPINKTPAPKPLNRVIPPAAAERPILDTVSPSAITLKQEQDMSKANSANLGFETCIVTGEELPISQMIRFAVDPEGTIVPDLTEKLPGQGFWLKAQKDIVKKAAWRNAFTTANRSPVNVPKDLLEIIELGLLKQSLETMGLARKAGLLTQGFAKVEEVLREDRAVLYIVATDAKDNGREKLERLADAADIPIIDIWTSSQLSAALGADNAVHVVLTSGGLTDKLLIIAHKLKDIR